MLVWVPYNGVAYIMVYHNISEILIKIYILENAFENVV